MTYSDVGGCKEQIEKLREVVETPLLHPERLVLSSCSPHVVCIILTSCIVVLSLANQCMFFTKEWQSDGEIIMVHMETMVT